MGKEGRGHDAALASWSFARLDVSGKENVIGADREKSRQNAAEIRSGIDDHRTARENGYYRLRELDCQRALEQPVMTMIHGSGAPFFDFDTLLRHPACRHSRGPGGAGGRARLKPSSATSGRARAEGGHAGAYTPAVGGPSVTISPRSSRSSTCASTDSAAAPCNLGSVSR